MGNKQVSYDYRGGERRMKIFELHPNEDTLIHHNWRASTYKKTLLIRAANEDHARRIARDVCWTGTDPGSPSQTNPTNPWSKLMGLVDCNELDKSPYPMEGEEEVLEPAYLNKELKRIKR